MTYKHVYNENIFTNANDISYYLLGVFVTDGCMKSGAVTLSSKDKEWLESIKNLFCPNLCLSKDGPNCWRISIANKTIMNWLFQHGCIPKKSTTLEFPKIPDNYLADFIRGCIDGDGSISHKQYMRIRNGKQKPFYSTHYSLTSASEKFVTSFTEILKTKNMGFSIVKSLPGSKKSIINGRLLSHKNTIYTISGGHQSAYKFLKWIYYPGNNIAMPRKLDMANKIINFYTEKIV